MRRWLAVLTSCLLSASGPSPVFAQFARSVRPSAALGTSGVAAPLVTVPNAVHAPLTTLSTPNLTPALPAPSAPSLTPALPAVAARAGVPASVAQAAVAPKAAAAVRAAAAAPASWTAPAAPDASAPFAAERPETAAGRLSALSLAKDVEPLWTGGAARPGAAPVTAAARLFSRPALAPSQARPEAAAEGPVEIPPQTLARRAKDAYHYARITGSSLWWYTFPRLIERWDEVREGIAKGEERAVDRIMGFFIAHRVMGSTGSYAPMGFRVAANRTVLIDAWRIYIRYFSDKPGSAEAFARLTARATEYNPNRRSTQFRKVLFHALREASVMPPEKVAAYFDSLLTDDKSAVLAGYQARRQGEVLALFDAAVRKVILDMNAGLPRGKRVVGAVLLGSFANGAAGPGSDLDVQTLTEDGRPTYNAEFLKRLKALWKSEGDPSHPVSGFEYALPLSKPLLQKVHREAYMVLSPYPEVTAAMSTAPEDLKGHATERTKGGLTFVAVYSAVLLGVLSAYEAWRLVSRLWRR